MNMCTYIYTCMYVRKHTHTHTHMYIHLYINMYIHTYITVSVSRIAAKILINCGMVWAGCSKIAGSPRSTSEHSTPCTCVHVNEKVNE